MAVKFPLPLSLVPGAGKTGDPVKMYLREMGLVSLLSREGEVEIAKKIEEGARETMSAIFRLPASIHEVFSVGEKLDSGELRIKSIVDSVEDEEGFMEEDEHKERVLKLIARIRLFYDRNAAIQLKLKSKTIRPKYRYSVPENPVQQKTNPPADFEVAFLRRRHRKIRTGDQPL